MMTLFINSVAYACPQRVEELSQQQIAQLHELNSRTPLSLLRALTAFPKNGSKKRAELNRFSRTLLRVWCGMPAAVVRKTPLEDRCRVIRQLGWPLLVASTGKCQVLLDRRSLRLPAADRDVNGVRMPLGYLSAVQLCEATDLYALDPLRYAHLIAAILCLPQGESYSERRVKTAAEGLRALPISVVLRLFGELNAAHAYLKKAFPSLYRSSAGGHSAAAEQEAPYSGWSEMMLWLAEYDPVRLQTLERMNAYNFMHLAQCKIKQFSRC